MQEKRRGVIFIGFFNLTNKAMTTKEEAIAVFTAKYEVWAKSQEGQTDAYAYEKSFDEFMQQVSKEILQESVGREADSRKKNCTHPVRGN